MTATPEPPSPPTDPQSPAAAPPNPEMTGTDLPLPQRGSSGIILAHIEALLDLALAAVPAPPLHDTSRAAAYGWLRDVQSGLWSRREQLWMARRVIEAFHAEQASAAAVERTRRALHRSQEAVVQRRAGTWWADREARRRSQRPARFTVDDDTWERHRRQAEAAGIGLGEHLGAVLALHNRNDTPERIGRKVDDSDTPTPRFLRLAIDDNTWADLKTAARDSNQTLTRHISNIVASE